MCQHLHNDTLIKYPGDNTCDIPVDPDNENQYIVWGIGGLGETAFKHFIRAEGEDT